MYLVPSNFCDCHIFRWTRCVTSEAHKLFIDPQEKLMNLRGGGGNGCRNRVKSPNGERMRKMKGIDIHPSHVWSHPTFQRWRGYWGIWGFEPSHLSPGPASHKTDDKLLGSPLPPEYTQSSAMYTKLLIAVEMHKNLQIWMSRFKNSMGLQTKGLGAHPQTPPYNINLWHRPLPAFTCLHSGPLCHALSLLSLLSMLLWTSMRRRRAAARSGEWVQHFSNASCLWKAVFYKRQIFLNNSKFTN